MSFHATRYAVTVCAGSDLSTADRLVLIVLAEHANRDGAAWPSSSTLAHETGLIPKSVRRCLARLVARGLIQPTTAPGRATRYQFPTPAKLSTVAPGEGQVSYPHLPPQGDNLPPGRGTGAPGEGHITNQEQAIEQSDRKSHEPSCAFCDDTGWIYEDDRHVKRCEQIHAS